MKGRQDACAPRAAPTCYSRMIFFAATRAAPSSAVLSFMITRTGIASSNDESLPLSMNAFIKVPSRSFSMIFGAIPPPTYTPAVALSCKAILPATAP